MKYLFAWLIGLALVSHALAAQTIYKSRDANGNILSDQPTSSSEAIEVELAPTYNSRSLSATKQLVPAKEAAMNYVLTILKPENGQTFTTEIQSIEVNLAIIPPLDNNHKIQLFLNGAPYGSPFAATHFTLGRLDRGIYQLKAAVANEAGQTKAESKVITFYQRRTSVHQLKN